MDDLISRQAVIDNAFEVNTKEYGNIEVVGIDAVMNLPTVEAVPVRHGKWNKVKHYDNVFSCSYCGELTTETVMGTPRFEFCPMCGAKMDG